MRKGDELPKVCSLAVWVNDIVKRTDLEITSKKGTGIWSLMRQAGQNGGEKDSASSLQLRVKKNSFGKNKA